MGSRDVTHYFSHAAWLREDQLLDDGHRLAGIPAVLIHGQLDIGSPLESPWLLSRAMPHSELVVLSASGHASDQLGDHVAAATDRFARTSVRG